MFAAKQAGRNAKVVNRSLFIDNNVFNISNIPLEYSSNASLIYGFVYVIPRLQIWAKPSRVNGPISSSKQSKFPFLCVFMVLYKPFVLVVFMFTMLYSVYFILLQQPASLHTSLFFSSFTSSQQSISEKRAKTIFYPNLSWVNKFSWEEIRVYLTHRLACVPLNRQQNRNACR